MTQQPDPFSELRGLMAEAVTNGSWAAFTDDTGFEPHTNLVSMKERTVCELALPGLHKNDPKVRLIVAAVNSLGALLDERDRMRASLSELSDRVFGTSAGSEPDVYADYDELCALQRRARQALSQEIG